MKVTTAKINEWLASLGDILRHIRWGLAISWRTHRWLFVAFWINALVSSALPAGAALAIRGLVNSVSDRISGTTSDLQDIYLWLAIGFLVALLVVVTDAFQQLISQRFRTELDFDMQVNLLEHSGRMDFAYFEDPEFRDTMHRASQQPGHRLANVQEVSLGMVTRGLQLLSILAILVVIEPLIFFLLLPIGIPNLWWQWRLSRRRFDDVDTRTEKIRWIHYYTRTLSRETDVAEVKLLNLAPLLIERAKRNMAEFRQLELNIQVTTFTGTLIFGLLSIMAVYAALTRATIAVATGDLTIGDIAIYGSAAMRLRSLVEGIMGYIASLRWEILHVMNLRRFLNIVPESLRDGHLNPNGEQGEIEFRDVTFTYPGTNRPVLTNLSFRVEPGETVALVGENGAGKTTIAKLIARFYDPDGGAILYNGENLKDIRTAHLRRRIAFVLQHFGRFSATAADNIAFGDWETLLDDRQKIEAFARASGVHDLIESMPDGYDTLLGRTFGYHVPSGGQWQQLAIARAMVRGANFLILDEPTANLDVRNEYELFSRFRELARGRTTILISHRFSTVSMADRILVLGQGRIVENGTHDELMRLGGIYATLYELHQKQMFVSPNGS